MGIAAGGIALVGGAETCFGRATLGFGCTVTGATGAAGTIGVPTTREGGVTVCWGTEACLACGTAGA